MRTLTIADNWKDWKFGDTDAVMTLTATDDGKIPDFGNKTLTFKIANTANNDLEQPEDFAATAPGYINGNAVQLKTEDVKQLTPGNYVVELWVMDNDTHKDAIYPSKGFAQFTIEENSMKVSDVTNIPSMTINAFWNAVMQKVGTLTKGAKGDPGQTPKIVMGSVTKLSPDAQPSATLVPLQSDPNTYTLNLQLPQGVQGEQGLQGIPGVGSKGLDGNNGLTPTIDPKTKHWMIGGTDTGVIAEGQAGKDADPSKYVTIVSFNQLRQQVQNNATALDAITAKYQKPEDNVKAAEAKVLNHQYEYMSMSIAIGNGVQGQSTFDNSYLACQNNLMDFTLIDRVDVQNETNFTLTDENMMKYAIGKLQQNGRKIVMLKPHLFLASDWEPYRGNYKPNDVSAFYTNWGKVLDRDARLCIDNNIPVLCIEVEMDEVFADANYEYARTMIANLRNKYPKLKLTVANDKYFVSGYQRIFDLVDFIGINIYPSYSSSVPTETNDISMAKAAEFMFNSDRLAEKIDDVILQFDKPILITEIGLYPFKEGLVQPLLQSTIQTGDIVSGKVVPDFSATALAMKAAINGFAYTPSVVGLTWFNSSVPMFFKDYYHDDLSTKNEAEKAWNQLCERYYWEGRNGK